MRYLVPLLLALTTTITANITCFEQYVPPFRHRYPIKKEDCVWLIETLIVGDKLAAPMHFSRDKNKGFELPWFRDHGTCTIGMDIITDEHLGDDFQLALVATIFSLIIDHCAENGDFKYGGGAPMGVAGRMSGIIMGRRPSPDEKRENFKPLLVHKRRSWSNSEVAVKYLAGKNAT